MISFVAICLLAWQPLASTGNDQGMWFIGDQDPTVLNFDAKTKGLDYSICARVSTEGYVILQRLSRRPIDMMVIEETLWFLDYSSSVALYAIRKSGDEHRSIAQATMQGILEIDVIPTELLSLRDLVVVGCSTESLQVHTFDGHDWKQLPTLEEPNARLANHNGTLVAAAPNEQGVHLWSLSDEQWQEGPLVELQGTLYDIMTKQNWLLFVSTKGDKAYILGLQGTNPIEIASFDIPKGSWSLVPSPEGITVIGVERNGTTSVLDLSWPSGITNGWVSLQQDTTNDLSIFERFPYLMPATVVLLFFLLMSRRTKAKLNSK
ncbi:MAG TPA: hypothetical protein EYO31_01475 [Phycisphaerales bacterium]|nr:hypothetical protein [Phycisphaerales bacterium]